ncbi:MAG TPA: prephenate dehydrogenase [Cytophagales bacterium]|mgnify:CR=1 FL=1|nr:prephenate dehydrogenase [Cytophagales bacterium]HCR54115.1 prephenate dehydrogenase [Cytophagales bacterium]
MRTTIVGLGLIGGSMAIDLRIKGIANHLIGVDDNNAHAQQAVDLGIVDEVCTLNEAVKNTDLIILAIPVSAMSKMIAQLLDKIESHITIIDTGSTKASICKTVQGHKNRQQFVAAHPIAGTENSGPSAAFSGLFRNKTMIICERQLSSSHALEVANTIFKALESKTIFMEPVDHDKHVAYVSHLSHVSSFLLGQTVMDIEKDEKNIFDLAGSGFASTVRLAKSSPDMWAPIFEQNTEYLSQALLEYIMHLQKFHYYLVKKDSKAIHRIMTEANEIRRVLSGIELKDEKNKVVETLIEE